MRPALIRILTDASSTEFQKAKACQRAGELGAKEAVPALAALLGDEHLSVYARYGLEPIADPSADDALRAALTKLKGVQLIGVINSIGKRRDAKASPRPREDDQWPRCRCRPRGGRGTGQHRRSGVRQGAAGRPPKTNGLTKVAVADASLVCAERLLAEGKRDQALALYASLSAPDVPKPARLAAMQGIIREETSINRR